MTLRLWRDIMNTRKPKGEVEMKITVPEYFTQFKCIADKCRDSCCIGWQIDIDELTMRKYANIDGDIGAEIAEKTSHGYFSTDKNGRCAFLDNSGLCRIISALGEGYLCDICHEHPRYYGVGVNGLEGGLGLGCEEAARIISSLSEKPRLIETERCVHYCDEDEYAGVSAYFRNMLIDKIFTKDYFELAGLYAAYATLADEVAFDVSATRKEIPIPKIAYTPDDGELTVKVYECMTNALLECEAMCDEWRELLNKTAHAAPDNISLRFTKLRGILYYFTHRYVREGVEDMSLGARIIFALGATLVIGVLAENLECEDATAHAAVLFSKNIEYSTTNTSLIIDKIYNVLE